MLCPLKQLAKHAKIPNTCKHMQIETASTQITPVNRWTLFAFERALCQFTLCLELLITSESMREHKSCLL